MMLAFQSLPGQRERLHVQFSLLMTHICFYISFFPKFQVLTKVYTKTCVQIFPAIFLKIRYAHLFERQSELHGRGGWSDKEIVHPSNDHNHQVWAKPKAGAGNSFSVSYVSSRVGSETLEPQSATFPDGLAGSKIESGVVWTSKPSIPIEDAGISSCGQTHCSETPTFLILSDKQFLSLSFPILCYDYSQILIPESG